MLLLRNLFAALFLTACSATDFGQSAAACKASCSENFQVCVQALYLYESAPDRSQTNFPRAENQALLGFTCLMERQTCQQDCSTME
ncbi:MAG: hypothetical protein HS115_02820 [Spirochaetales bacterium]|nr:hypothetical protein [Spirochaetales bacterium]